MSLLIDALRRAEQSRQQPGGEVPQADGEGESRLELAPQPKSNELATEQPAPAARPTRPPTPNYEARQTAAKQLFANSVARAPAPSPSRLPILLALSGLLLLGAGAIYLWYATQPRSALFTGSSQTVRPIAEPAHTPAAAPESPVMAAASPGEASQSTPTSSTPSATVKPSPSPRAGGGETSLAGASALPALPSGNHIARAAAQRPSPADTPLGQAYSAYTQADLSRATPLYREALRSDPKNADALNGLAMIALHNGADEEAYRLFKEVLKADPKNAQARAQLLLLRAESAPLEAESGLRSLLAEQGDAAAAHFALGSLLARQGRWREAQQAFFAAYTVEAGNPDVIYNLAVSLDHLHQTKLAQQYYEQALRLASSVTVSFDPIAARRRLAAIKQADAALGEPSSNHE